MSASGNHKTEQGRPVFSVLFLNSLIHAANPPLHSGSFRGDSISILVPSFALPINSFLPCVGPLVSFFFYSIKLARMGILFLLFVF